MAYSEEKWNKAKAYFEAGLTLSQISEKTLINKSAISRKAKKQQWQHGKNTDYIEAREIIATKKATESNTSLHFADEDADANIRRKNLVFGGLEKLAQRMNDQVEANKKMDKLNVGMGVQNFEPVELNPQDYKALAEGYASVGKSLGVIEEKPQVAIQNNNIVEVEIE